MSNITIQDFENIIPFVWTKETCYEPWQNSWSVENKAKGQCFVTAKLFQDFFGGQIMKAKDTSNTSHYWNLFDGIEYDFTKSQYPEGELFLQKQTLDHIESSERCKILKTNFLKKFWKEKVSFYVIEGSVTFFGGIQRMVSGNDRFDVPVGIEHTAKVGNEGCQYVVGQEIEGDA